MDTERVHADAALALLAEEEPDLFAYAITVTDRIQHGFWRDHEPAAYAPKFAPHKGLQGRDPVENAYRMADGLLGDFLEALPSDTLVFDHGVAPALDKGEGGHRVEGVWIAAGPGIESSNEDEELSLLDLVPTVLYCVGAPAAEDMPGRVAQRVCPGAGPEARIPSYRSEANLLREGGDDDSVTIDATREAQLRSLGYIE
jgi:predicted AlkP superfamily phosphohydrolase/phosphomutase